MLGAAQVCGWEPAPAPSLDGTCWIWAGCPAPDHQEARDLVAAATLAYEDEDSEEQQEAQKDWKEAHAGA